ncbi:ATP-grasp domain-containing protein [Brucella intermedia]|uniref:ATP-grasp domain-containing protein n=1 Tax=Brucella intermedia TaxID=94625 RepID=UPI002360A30D|nr:ATP-grasp domain-containing protein [Brucella intermedia]
MDKNYKVLIIDPFVSPRYLALALKQENIVCDALYSAPPVEPSPYVDNADSLFDKILNTDSFDDGKITAAVLKGEYDFILNGAEEATYLTDQIASICLPTLSNDPLSSKLRVDKSEMNLAAARAGLDTIRECVIQAPFEEHDVCEAAAHVGLPVFCKPLYGYGGVGAFRADTKLEILNRLNTPVPLQHQQYLVQKEIVGQELLVDTFSARGVHHVCSVCRNPKEIISNQPVYRMTSVEEDPNMWSACANYVRGLLDAIGLMNGFAHTELFLEPDGTIRLIELNNRISGGHGAVNKITTLCGLTSQVDALCQFLRSGVVHTRPPHVRKGHARNLVLFGFTANGQEMFNDRICSFSTVKEVIPLKTGKVTNGAAGYSLLDASSIIIMHSEDPALIEEQTKGIFALEQLARI